MARPPSDIGATSRILNWFVLELGTAMLLDTLGGHHLVPTPPAVAVPANRAVAGPIALLRLAHGEAPGERLVETIHGATPERGIVMVAAEGQDVATFGSNLALEAWASGAIGIVTDGAFRDAELISQTSLFAAGDRVTPLGGDAYHRYEPLDEFTAFGTTWRTGDWLAHDADGFLHIASDDIPSVVGSLLKATDEPLDKLIATAP